MRYVMDKLVAHDWEQVRTIYLEGIATGDATFEEEPPPWEEWDSSHMQECRLVARSGNNILGWAALSPTSSRCAYLGVVEVSIYVGKRYQRQGIGTALLAGIIEASEKNGIWTLQAGIFPENIVSLNLHRQHGFREVGRREKVGKMTFGQLKGVWRDVVLMERRSKVVGVD
jgi:L-amino acid N-acyltransferase YncA